MYSDSDWCQVLTTDRTTNKLIGSASDAMIHFRNYENGYLGVIFVASSAGSIIPGQGKAKHS